MLRGMRLFLYGFGLLLMLGAPACTRPGADGPSPLIAFELEAKVPHDPEAFTQGLLFHDGLLYESTGLYGQSSLRTVDPATGKVLKRRSLGDAFFGEGLALVSNRLYQLTWRENVVFVYDRDTLNSLGTLPLRGEGWGLTVADGNLVVSDGSDQLHIHDPATMNFLRSIPVRYRGKAVFRLNELEMIGGDLFANIWESDYIARIDLATGEVTGWIDASSLYPRGPGRPRENVLNGIAHDPATGRTYLTGKRWSAMFVIRLVTP